MTEFVQRTIPPQKDCGEYATWGTPSASYHYIFKGNKNPDDYPEEACQPWYHQTAQIDSLRVNTSIIGDGLININGEVTAPKFNGVAT